MLSGRRTREHSCLASVLVLCNLISISYTVDCTPAGCTLCAAAVQMAMGNVHGRGNSPRTLPNACL